MKKICSLLLAALMVLTSLCVFAEGEFPRDVDLVGMFSQYPLVKEGDPDVTLRVIVPMDDAYANDWKDEWFWQWWTAKTGIKFEVETVLKSAMNERRNLLFAADDLPDIILNFGLKTDELMRYGAGEKQLLDFKPYITEDIMPNLTTLMKKFPVANANSTAADGGVYSLPYFVNRPNLHGEESRIFMDWNRLQQAGKDIPTTLDEFIETLYTFKENDPDCIPLGGSWTATNPGYYLLNAMGFLGKGDTDGTQITVRNGEAVIPAGDPLYKNYLEIMHQFYTDGIISEDFFTADSTTVNAQMSEGKIGVYPFVPFTVTPDQKDWEHWRSVKPLTSEYNDTPQWLSTNGFQVGGFAASAKTKYPEIIAKLADFFYSDIGMKLMWTGPYYGSSDTLGLVSGKFVRYNDTLDSYGVRTFSEECNDEIDAGKYANMYEWINYNTPTSLCFGNNGVAVSESEKQGFDISPANYALSLGCGFKTQEDYDYFMEHYLDNNPYPQFGWDEEGHYKGTSPENCFRESMLTNITPYRATGFPDVVYFSEDEALKMNDLETVIKPFVESETAKFITGARSLDEFDAYIAELEKLGFRDWENYYKTAWATYQANLE